MGANDELTDSDTVEMYSIAVRIRGDLAYVLGDSELLVVDVTDPSSPSFMWEFSDPDLFRSRSSPAVAQIGRIVVDGETSEDGGVFTITVRLNSEPTGDVVIDLTSSNPAAAVPAKARE